MLANSSKGHIRLKFASHLAVVHVIHSEEPDLQKDRTKSCGINPALHKEQPIIE